MKFLPPIPHDKANHISYGALLALVGALVSLVINQPMWLGALALCIFFAVGKEIFDRTSKKGTPDVFDTLSTVAGALPTVVVGLLAEYICQ